MASQHADRAREIVLQRVRALKLRGLQQRIQAVAGAMGQIIAKVVHAVRKRARTAAACARGRTSRAGCCAARRHWPRQTRRSPVRSLGAATRVWTSQSSGAAVLVVPAHSSGAQSACVRLRPRVDSSRYCSLRTGCLQGKRPGVGPRSHYGGRPGGVVDLLFIDPGMVSQTAAARSSGTRRSAGSSPRSPDPARAGERWPGACRTAARGAPPS
jgi:hypothetical protein